MRNTIGVGAVLLCLCAFFLLMPVVTGAATPQQQIISEALSSKKETSQSPTPQELVQAGPQKMDEILAAMSDEQVRRLLIETLRMEAGKEKKTAAPTLFDRLDDLRDDFQFLHERMVYVFSGVARASDLLPENLRELMRKKGYLPVPSLVLGLAGIIAIWFLSLHLLFWKTRRLRARIVDVPEASALHRKVVWLFSLAMIELLLLALAALVSVALYLLLFNHLTGTKAVLFLWLVIVVLLEFQLLLVRLLLAPGASKVRLFPLQDSSARHIYRLCQVLAFEVGIGLTACGVLQLTGASEAAYLLVLILTGFAAVLTISMIVLWRSKDVAATLRKAFPKGTLRHQMAGVWHIIAVGYLFFFWFFWMAHVVASGKISMLPGLLTLLVFPLYLLLAWIMDKIVIQAGHVASGALLKPNSTPSNPEDDSALDENGRSLSADCPVGRFRRVLARILSLLLAFSFIIVLAAIWRIELPVGERVVSGAFSVLVTLVLAYAFWAFSRAAIERKLQAQIADGAEEGGEPGHGAGDRLSTLLELLKRFIFVTLLVVVTLIVLSSVGVDTSPLLAGAGVIGIAIGFGSQTLVKDIVSGVFFLMDDAFRIGDYIDLGDSRGTVEGISVRSLKLRHHRGSLYTVPYGSIKMVNNLTRDWAIMKLQYMVPFDTDIQQVKKIVKRINKELKEVPELAALMLGDVKSQGVKDVEDYGMRMRIKMTTIPGGQFTLRKWIWGKLRRYFDEAGIQFANRKVSVVMSEGLEDDHDKNQKLGAAASQAVQEQLEREEQQKKA